MSEFGLMSIFGIIIWFIAMEIMFAGKTYDLKTYRELACGGIAIQGIALMFMILEVLV